MSFVRFELFSFGVGNGWEIGWNWVMRRREMIERGVLAMAGVSSGLGAEKVREKEEKGWPVVFFEKPLQALAYDRMGEELEKLRLAGIEATIRKGGHIEPGKAEEEVPKMVADLAKNGRVAMIAATGVNEANEENAQFLRVLRANGITKFRMDYFRYDLKKDVWGQLREFAGKMREVAAMSRELGMQGLYQLHAGRQYAGALGWDARMMLEGVAREDVAVAFDLRHVKVGSGISYEAALAALRSKVGALYVKDSRWVGKASDEVKNVPLGEGFVNEEMFALTRRGMSAMPISLHVEWAAKTIFPKDRLDEGLAALARDVKTLQSWLAK